MNKHWPYHWLVFLVCVTLSLPGHSSSSAQKSEREEGAAPAQETELQLKDATPVEFDRLIEIDRTLHFLSPQGKDVVVSSGIYTVEATEGGLRLIPSEETKGEALTIEAKPTSHEQSVKVPEPMLIPGEEDQHVVMLLLPDGKAMQAVGSYSGVRGRGSKKGRGKKGVRIGGRTLNIFVKPSITNIAVRPPDASYDPEGRTPEGTIAPGGRVYIRGRNIKTYSSGRSRVFLQLNPNTQRFNLRVTSWNNNIIVGQVPRNITGVQNQRARLYVVDERGATSPPYYVPFHAHLTTRRLDWNDPAIKLVHCASKADMNGCIGVTANTSKTCLIHRTPAMRDTNSLSITAIHANCNRFPPKTSTGIDRYKISLQNGWVWHDAEFVEIGMGGGNKRKSGNMEWINRNLPGKSDINFRVDWIMAPKPNVHSGKLQVEYGYNIRIIGPRGVPHF